MFEDARIEPRTVATLLAWKSDVRLDLIQIQLHIKLVLLIFSTTHIISEFIGYRSFELLIYHYTGFNLPMDV